MLSLIFRSLLLFFGFSASLTAYELSICAIFQNEADYLEEWIEYHLLMGVEHFWLYNNDSLDDYKTVLLPYIEEGVVELIEWSTPNCPPAFQNWLHEVQITAYQDGVQRAKKFSKWLAIIDIDEFIVPLRDDTILECINKKYSKVSGLCVNWQHFGTSKIKRLDPDKPMIAQLIYKKKWDDPLNRIFKSIVRLSCVQDCISSHFCSYISKYHVNGNLEEVLDIDNGVHIDELQINHYWSRDEYFLENIKIPRYNRWNEKNLGPEIRTYVETMNFEIDTSILRFIPRLEERLHKRKEVQYSRVQS